MHDVHYEKTPKNIVNLFIQIPKLYIHTTRVHLLAIFTYNTQNYKSSLKHSQDSEQGLGMRYQPFLREKLKKLIKTKLHEALLDVLHHRDDYVDVSQIEEAVKT